MHLCIHVYAYVFLCAGVRLYMHREMCLEDILDLTTVCIYVYENIHLPIDEYFLVGLRTIAHTCIII